MLQHDLNVTIQCAESGTRVTFVSFVGKIEAKKVGVVNVEFSINRFVWSQLGQTYEMYESAFLLSELSGSERTVFQYYYCLETAPFAVPCTLWIAERFAALVKYGPNILRSAFLQTRALQVYARVMLFTQRQWQIAPMHGLEFIYCQENKCYLKLVTFRVKYCYVFSKINILVHLLKRQDLVRAN